MSQPKASIIIACYNQAPYVRECIISALSQDYPSFEVIFVDNSSTDGSHLIANNFSSQIKQISQPNYGPSSARNRGINTAKGEYIVCLDADDILNKNFLKKTVPVLVNDNSIGIVSTGYKFFGTLNKNIIPKELTFPEHLAINNIPCTCLFRKIDWKNVGGFDESFKSGFEDWDFWICLRKTGLNIKVVPDFLFYYRRKFESKTTVDHAHFSKNLHKLHSKHLQYYKSYCLDIHTTLFGVFHNQIGIATTIYDNLSFPKRVINKICKLIC